MFPRFAAAAGALLATAKADGQVLNDIGQIPIDVNNIVAQTDVQGDAPAEPDSTIDTNIEKTTVACCVFNDVDGSEHKDVDFEFEGLRPGEHRISSYGERSYCGFDYIPSDSLPETHAELEQQVAESGKLRTIDALDPVNERIDDSNLAKLLERLDSTFMENRPRGPDYLVIDNFAEYFGLQLSDLQGARGEAETLTSVGCQADGAGEAGARCDALMWLQGLGTAGDDNPALRKIYQAIDGFRPKVNEISQEGLGDSTLRVDRSEVVVSRANGASGKEQKYHRHKDSYRRDKNNELHGQELRKLSVVVFLNEDLDQLQPDAQKGMLRLFPRGESVEGVVDIAPRLGRAVLFKSERVLHESRPTLGWDNYAVTFYLDQVVNKPPTPHPVPNDWKMFVGIAAYRDLQLVHTLRSLVSKAAHPERLRIVVYNQYDFWGEWDQQLAADVKRYIDEAARLPNPPSILMESVSHRDAKNCYHARFRLQRHYKGETYQLQLDSHHRAVQDWDVKMINMLHSCDAGDKSVLTVYARPYGQADAKDGYSEDIFAEGPPPAMSHYEVREDGMPAWKGRSVEKNAHKLTKPWETPLASGHYCFSHGHLLENAGHDGSFENNFSWEEIWMAYAYWKAGYTLYAPNEVLIYHNYDRSYRPQFAPDAAAGADDQGEGYQKSYEKNSGRMREIIFGDAEFRQYMDEKWGVDLLGREGSQKATDAGLDPYYFWDPRNPIT